MKISNKVKVDAWVPHHEIEERVNQRIEEGCRDGVILKCSSTRNEIDVVTIVWMSHEKNANKEKVTPKAELDKIAKKWREREFVPLKDEIQKALEEEETTHYSI